jgi:carnitine 3-dehydrogenase
MNYLVTYLIDCKKLYGERGCILLMKVMQLQRILDRAIEDGPGLRWSLMGTFLTFHLAGGKSGMRHMLEQFGPALKLPWTKLKAPTLSNKLIDRLVQGTKKQSKGKSVSKISNIRDEYLVELQKLRKKYEKKLR